MSYPTWEWLENVAASSTRTDWLDCNDSSLYVHRQAARDFRDVATRLALDDLETPRSVDLFDAVEWDR